MVLRTVEVSLRQRAIVLLATLVLIGVGVWSALRLPIDAVPDITNPQVLVNTAVPALAPEEIEELVTLPLESQMAGLPGMIELRSLSKFGLSQIRMTFEDGVDLYRTRQLVTERLLSAAEKLPPALQPRLAPISTALGEIFYYTVEFKRVARATRPPRSATRRTEWRGRTNQSASHRMIRCVQPFRPAGRRAAQASRLCYQDEGRAIDGAQADSGIRHQPAAPRHAGCGRGEHVGRLRAANRRHARSGATGQRGPQPGRTGALYQREHGTPAADWWKIGGETNRHPRQQPRGYDGGNRAASAQIRRVGAAVARTGRGAGWHRSSFRTGAATVNGAEGVVGGALMLAGGNSRIVARDVAAKLSHIQEKLPPGVEVRPLYNARTW